MKQFETVQNELFFCYSELFQTVDCCQSLEYIQIMSGNSQLPDHCKSAVRSVLTINKL